ISSVVIPRAAVPDMGRTRARGSISGGIPTKTNTGEINSINASNAPELLKIAIDTIIPTKKGSKENAIFTPSFPPSTNSSYVGRRLYVATVKTINIKHGIIQVLINVIVSMLSLLPWRFVIFYFYQSYKINDQV